MAKKAYIGIETSKYNFHITYYGVDTALNNVYGIGFNSYVIDHAHAQVIPTNPVSGLITTLMETGYEWYYTNTDGYISDILYDSGSGMASVNKWDLEKTSSTLSLARKVKKMYLGIPTDLPIYSEETRTVAITADNIADYFYVTNGSSYYFAGSGDTFTSNNAGVDDSTATTILTAKYDISTLTFSYSYSSEANYDKFTLRVAGVTVEDAVSGATTSKSYGGSLAAGQTIEFTYAKDSSTNKNDDKCTFSTMELTATVLTQTGTERKSVARKVKKAYIGIGGVARPCFSGGELKYYGTITPLSAARSSFAATTVGSYALFGGGYTHTPTVEVYNKSLVRSTADELTGSNRENLAATTVGNYALFAGGGNNNWSLATVDAYNTSLVKSTPDALSAGKQDLAATTVGNYALFGGGHYGSNYRYGTVDAYNTSLVKSTPDALSTVKYYTAATTVGNYALFGGGIYGTDRNYLTNTVDAYNTSLVKSTTYVLSVARRCLVATTVGNYALFAGGNGSGSSSFFATVDAYNASLVKSTPDALSAAKDNLAATTVGDYALFAGGYGTSGYSDAVDAYNTSLIKSTPDVLSAARHSFAATTVGNYALFAGGVLESGDRSSAVDAYTA